MSDKSSTESLTKDEETKAFQMLSLLEIHEESQEFLAPVDFIRLGIPQYPTIIKHPMDLGTIKKRVKSHYYRTLNEFISDTQLVWDNCKKYNEQSTDIHQQAVYLERQMKRYCSKLRIPIPHSKNKPGDLDGEDAGKISFEEKWRMTESVRKLSQSALEKVVECVSQKCPQAIENMESDKIKIKLDVITREVFSMLQGIAEEWSSEALPMKRCKKG